jgi:hypothetical protein
MKKYYIADLVPEDVKRRYTLDTYVGEGPEQNYGWSEKQVPPHPAAPEYSNNHQVIIAIVVRKDDQCVIACTPEGMGKGRTVWLSPRKRLTLVGLHPTDFNKKVGRSDEYWSFTIPYNKRDRSEAHT